jgi:hypothetical protein
MIRVHQRARGRAKASKSGHWRSFEQSLARSLRRSHREFGAAIKSILAKKIVVP